MTFLTHYSFRHATGSPEEVCARLKELGYEYAPISDIASTYGFVKWRDACEKHGLKPIFGVSIYVTPMIAAKKPVTDLFRFYAVDDIKPINDLVRKAYEQGRSLPRIGFTPLLKYSDLANLGNVIKVSGYRARLEHMDSQDANLFVGLSPACAQGFINRATEGGFKFFPMQEARYVNIQDRDFYQIAAGFNADLKTYPQYIEDDNNWLVSLSFSIKNSADQIASAWKNRDNAFATCRAELKKGSLPEPLETKTLEELCRENIATLVPDWTQEYEDRLQLELKTIADKNFEPYFYLVHDLMSWARTNMIVGPGRGSSGGSLVCFLLLVTTIDPIKYNLLFFRFLDPSRPDWPDCDIDFANRDGAIDYLVNRYGINRVAKLGTVGSFQAKNSTNEVTKQLSLPRFEFDNLISSLPKYAAGDARGSKAIDVALKETDLGRRLVSKYPGFELAGRLSGTPSNAATHASGVLLTNDDISNYLAVNSTTNTAHCDLKEAEKLDIQKLDILGLLTLEIFEKTLELAGLPRDFLETVPLDDQESFDVLNDGRFVGLFQYEGDALRYLTSKIKVDCFDDIVIISALARPGGLSSGAADSWAKRKMGREAVSYPHPLLEPYLSETKGVMAFQETLMLIAKNVANLDWNQVSKLRKAVGKSLGPEAMKEYEIPFKDGMLASGVSQEVTDKFWSDILGASAYMFNKAHSVAYGMMSYWSCYLKAHFPLEFTAAALTMTDSQEKQVAFLREIAKEGVSYVPVDVDHSTDRWTVANKGDKKILIGPLSSVKGLGPKKIQQILGARARNEPIPDSIRKLLEHAKTDLDSLNPIRDTIQKLNWKAHVNATPTPIAKAVPTGGWQDYVVIGLVSKVEERDENEERKREDRKARGQAEWMEGDAKSWEIRLDSDEVKGYFCKVTAKKFAEFSEQVLQLSVGKSIVAISGSTVPGIPCMVVKGLSVIGEME